MRSKRNEKGKRKRENVKHLQKVEMFNELEHRERETENDKHYKDRKQELKEMRDGKSAKKKERQCETSSAKSRNI